MSDSWDKFFMDMAKLVASKSKDRSRKVGCVIVGPDNEVRSVGYNGFPRGIADHIEWRHERPAKYKWTEHAERNAIYNSARAGIRTEGCRIYTWGRDFRSGVDMLREAHVGVRYYCDDVA
jgi:dCMP deaminase